MVELSSFRLFIFFEITNFVKWHFIHDKNLNRYVKFFFNYFSLIFSLIIYYIIFALYNNFNQYFSNKNILVQILIYITYFWILIIIKRIYYSFKCYF